VFIDTTTLDYIHVHPTAGGEMPGMDMGHMDMSARALPDDAPIDGNMQLDVVAPQPARTSCGSNSAAATVCTSPRSYCARADRAPQAGGV